VFLNQIIYRFDYPSRPLKYSARNREINEPRNRFRDRFAMLRQRKRSVARRSKDSAYRTDAREISEDERRESIGAVSRRERVRERAGRNPLKSERSGIHQTNSLSEYGSRAGLQGTRFIARVERAWSEFRGTNA